MEYQNMSNAELKLVMEKLTNEFEAKKNALIILCKEMERVEHEYLSAQKELDMRKNIYI